MVNTSVEVRENPNTLESSELAQDTTTMQSIILYKGMKHVNIKDLKMKLNRLGFGELKVDLVYGDFTEKKVKMFQSHYGLEVTGIADIPTLSRIEDLINSPFQLNSHHEDILELKQKLNWIGYGKIKVTNLYGPTMERHIKKFQEDHDLPVSGIVDDLTYAKIDETLSNLYKVGNRHEQIAELKRKLNRLGFKGIQVSDAYGPFLEQRVKEFQSFYGLPTTGNADFETLHKMDEILSSPLQVGKQDNRVIALKENLFTLGYGELKKTSKFGKATEKEVKRFQRDYDLPENGIVDEMTLAKIYQAINYNEKVSYTRYPITLEKALEIQMKASPHIRDSLKAAGKEAEEAELAIYLNPMTFINDKIQKFQFLNLSKAKVVAPEVLDKYLEDKGMLKDMGDTLIEAGVTYGINELYLVSLALLESNNGSSILAQGVPVNNKGEITYVNSMIDGVERVEPGVTNETVKVVYNPLGINDENIHNIDHSVKKAYNEDWDTPEKAIKAGAKFAKEKYLLNDKNTFYKMRWQPDTMSESGEIENPVSDDIAWSSKQILPIYHLYQELDSYELFLDIPVYQDQPVVKYKRG